MAPAQQGKKVCSVQCAVCSDVEGHKNFLSCRVEFFFQNQSLNGPYISSSRFGCNFTMSHLKNEGFEGFGVFALLYTDAKIFFET